jgi:sucrose phosphorylase
MTVLKTLVGCLYPNSKDEVIEGIEVLKTKYDLQVSQTKLSEKDVILITYGDGIINPDEAPLTTLKKFCCSHLKGSISAVHLLPCFPYSSDDGFSVIDYYEINPDLGNWKHIDDLADHFDLMFDAVVNHMSKKSDWFKSFLKREAPYEDYFVTADPNLDYSTVVRPRALPLVHEYEGKDGKVAVWTTFSEDQVDLNYRNPGVFLQVLDILLFYVSKGARFIRLDAIAFLWKQIGTTCIHLPETHLVIQAYRKVLDEVAPSTVLITETNVPHEENISYFGDGYNEAHMVYNFTLPPLLALSVHQENVDTLLSWAKSLELTGNTCFFNFTASHDGVGVRPLQGIVPTEAINDLANKVLEHGGFVSYKDNGDGTQSPYELNCNYLDVLTHPEEDDAIRIQRFLLTQSVMLCMPGVPGVYYHSILGSRNDRKAAVDSGINRRINRSKLNVNELNNSLKNRESLRAKVFDSYSKILRIRREESLFNPYGMARYKKRDKVFIIERIEGDSKLYGLHNFSSKTIQLEPMDGVELLYGSTKTNKPWVLGPFDFQWLKK